MRALSPRDVAVLRALDDEQWLRPMDVGGRDGSHHSATLARLARAGLAERRKSCWCGPGSQIEAAILARGGTPRWPWCRCKGSCRYRRTQMGRVYAASAAAVEAIARVNRKLSGRRNPVGIGSAISATAPPAPRRPGARKRRRSGRSWRWR